MLILGAIAVAIAGCGGDDPAPRQWAAATATPAVADATGAWVDQSGRICDRHTARLERLLADVDRALLQPRGGSFPHSVRRYSAAVSSLFDDLKELERPTGDRRVNQLISRYAVLVTALSQAVQDFEWSREAAVRNVAYANEIGADLHGLAKQIGAEACTSWLVGA